MTKPTITKTWIAGMIVAVVGLMIAGVAVGVMLTNAGEFVHAVSGNGYDFVPRYDGLFWTTIGFTIAGSAVVLVGLVLQLVAWVGALMNTYQLEDKTWFIVLLAGGLIGLGFALVELAVMIAYIIAGPDATTHRELVARPHEPSMQRPTPLAPTA